MALLPWLQHTNTPRDVLSRLMIYCDPLDASTTAAIGSSLANSPEFWLVSLHQTTLISRGVEEGLPIASQQQTPSAIALRYFSLLQEHNFGGALLWARVCNAANAIRWRYAFQTIDQDFVRQLMRNIGGMEEFWSQRLRDVAGTDACYQLAQNIYETGSISHDQLYTALQWYEHAHIFSAILSALVAWNILPATQHSPFIHRCCPLADMICRSFEDRETKKRLETYAKLARERKPCGYAARNMCMSYALDASSAASAPKRTFSDASDSFSARASGHK